MSTYRRQSKSDRLDMSMSSTHRNVVYARTGAALIALGLVRMRHFSYRWPSARVTRAFDALQYVVAIRAPYPTRNRYSNVRGFGPSNHISIYTRIMSARPNKSLWLRCRCRCRAASACCSNRTHTRRTNEPERTPHTQRTRAEYLCVCICVYELHKQARSERRDITETYSF